MPYLIYIPGEHVVPGVEASLRAVGLEMLCGPNVHSIQQRDIVTGGPDGGGGRLVNWFDAEHRDWEQPLKLTPELQWFPVKPRSVGGSPALPAGRYWLARDPLRPILPEMLARPHQYASCGERLLDGNTWQMPIARDLPRNLGLDASGNLSRTVKPAMRNYFDRAEKFFGEYLQADTSQETFTIEHAWSFCAEGLGMNYYVNPDVLDWLGLLDETVLYWLVGASFELRKLLDLSKQLQKKTAGADSAAIHVSSTLSPGPAA